MASPLSIAVPLRQRDTITAIVCIDLLNFWARFSRSFYLSCLLFPRTTLGRRLTARSRVTDVNVAIGEAVREWRPGARPRSDGTWHRRDEPAWHDANVLLKLAQHWSFSDVAEVGIAFSLGSRVFVDLPVVRNYFAHRSKETREAALKALLHYGITASRLCDALLQRPLGRPQSLLLEWIDEISTTTELLLE